MMMKIYLNVALLFIMLLKPIWSLVQDGYEILDLQSTDALFESEASAWTMSPMTGNSTASQCSTTWLLGGVGVIGTPQTTLSRNYTSLSGHNMIYFTVEVWLIDLTLTGSSIDLFAFYFDETLVQDWTIVSPTLMYSGNKCGGPTTDYYSTQVYGQVPHSRSELDVKIVKKASPTNNFTVGFRSLQFSLGTASNTNLICQFKDHTGTSRSCECYDGWYDNSGGGSSGCNQCNSACTYCFGPSPNDCLGCKDGYYFDGQRCGTCHSSCERCDGTTSSNCTQCPTGKYLYPNSTCQSTCKSPMVVIQDADVAKCQLPCDSGSFLYWNGTCKSQCEAPLKQNKSNSLVWYCQLPCNETLGEYYSPENDTCISGCASPLIIEQTDLMKTCVTPPPAPANSSNGTIEEPPQSSENSTNVTTLGSFAQFSASVAKQVSTIGSALRPTNPNSVFMISIAKLIRYVIYIQVPLLDEVRQAFQSSNSSIFSISTAFTYSLPQSLKNKFSNQPVPSPFNENITTASYLYNNWEPISTYIILFLTGVGFSLLEYLINKTKKQVLIEFVRRLRILTRWNFVLLIFFNSYDNFTLYAILEIRTLQLDSSLAIISFVTCICVSLLAVFLLWILFKACMQAQKERTVVADINSIKKEDPSSIMDSCQVFYAGYKNDTFLKQGCLLFQTIRIVIYYVLVGYLYSQPLIQVSQLTGLSIVMISYYIKERPFRDKFNMFVTLVYEILVLVVNISLLSLAILDEAGNLSSQLQTILSEVILICNTAIELCATIFMYVYILLAMKSAYKASKTCLRGKTLWIYVPITAYESPGLDFKDDLPAEPHENKNDVPNESSKQEVKQNGESIKRKYLKIVSRNSIMNSNSQNAGESDSESFAKRGMNLQSFSSLNMLGDQTKSGFQTTTLNTATNFIPDNVSKIKLLIKRLYRKNKISARKIVPVNGGRQLKDLFTNGKMKNHFIVQGVAEPELSIDKYISNGNGNVKESENLDKELHQRTPTLKVDFNKTSKTIMRLSSKKQAASLKSLTPKVLLDNSNKNCPESERLQYDNTISLTNRSEVPLIINPPTAQRNFSTLGSKRLSGEGTPSQGEKKNHQPVQISINEIFDKETFKAGDKFIKQTGNPNSIIMEESNVSSTTNLFGQRRFRKKVTLDDENGWIFQNVVTGKHNK